MVTLAPTQVLELETAAPGKLVAVVQPNRASGLRGIVLAASVAGLRIPFRQVLVA